MISSLSGTTARLAAMKRESDAKIATLQTGLLDAVAKLGEELRTAKKKKKEKAMSHSPDADWKKKKAKAKRSIANGRLQPKEEEESSVDLSKELVGGDQRDYGDD